MNGHASKPIQSRSLLAAIEEHLAKSRSLTNPQELPATPPPEVANSATPPARDEKKGDDLASLPPYATAELVARCVGDVGLAGRVLRKFLAQLPRQLDELRLRMEKRDIAGTARVAHAIKGAAANLSARRLARVAGDLEQAARDGEGGSLSLLAEQVESEVDFCLRAGVGLAGTLAVETV